MKRIICGLVVMLSAVLMLFSGVSATSDVSVDKLDSENFLGVKNAIDIIPATDDVPEFAQNTFSKIETNVIFLDTGETYPSEDAFMQDVGNDMKNSDPKMNFYVYYIAGKPAYIHSNRILGEVLHSYIN